MTPALPKMKNRVPILGWPWAVLCVCVTAGQKSLLLRQRFHFLEVCEPVQVLRRVHGVNREAEARVAPCAGAQCH